MEYTQEFNELWLIKPKRGGGNSKIKAFKQYKARLKAKHSHGDIEAGLIRYSVFCHATDKIGTEYVMMLSTFFGVDEWFMEEWELPRIEAKESLLEKAKRLGLTPNKGESQFNYDMRVRDAK